MSKTIWHDFFAKEFQALDSNLEILRAVLENFGKTLAALKVAAIDHDFKTVQKAALNLNALAHKDDFKHKPTSKKFIEELREFRHALRSACGAAIGFSELIEEQLTDLEQNTQEAHAALLPVFQVAQKILEIISEFSLGDSNLLMTDVAEPHLLTTKNKANVLIIDDNPDKLEMLRRRVSKIGHAVQTASGGKAGLDAINQCAPDIILLDLIMPDISGFEVLNQIKKSPNHNTIPVLIISSSNDMANVTRCIQQGADDYLPTPVNNTLLYSRIEACVSKKFTRDRELKTMCELNRARHLLATAIESIDEGFAIFSSDDKLLKYNSKFEELYPAVRTLKLEKSSYEDFLRASLKEGTYVPERRHHLQKKSKHVSRTEIIEDWIKLALSYHKNPGKPQIIRLTNGKWIEVIENQIPEGGVVAVHKDVSVGKQREEKLKYFALHDPLTGLMNRKSYEQTLEKVFDRSQKTQQSFGILFFDLDGFKNVNDTLGHDFGDFLLKEVAKKLTKCLRTTDYLARLGGDEFTAIITDSCTLDDLEAIASRCLKSIGTSVEQDHKVANFGVSIGLALYPLHGTSIDEVLKKADEAMYEAKKSGKGSFKIAK